MRHSFSSLLLAAPLLASGLLFSLTGPWMQQDQERPGHDGTPKLPGSEWRVHDKDRPHPRIVEPGDAGLPVGAKQAPSDAIVLFDGSSLAAWKGRGGDAEWDLVEGVMRANRSGDIETRQGFGDCQLHVEFRTPTPAKGTSQGRGNSGVFFMGRYEVQILDSYQNATYPDGQAAALYGQAPPLVNASRAPGEWQSFDIVFRAPRFQEDGSVQEPAHVTVFHNGVCVHHHRAMIGATAHARVARYEAHAPRGPIRLQDHGDPIEFRNIWVRAMQDYDVPEER